MPVFSREASTFVRPKFEPDHVKIHRILDTTVKNNLKISVTDLDYLTQTLEVLCFQLTVILYILA